MNKVNKGKIDFIYEAVSKRIKKNICLLCQSEARYTCKYCEYFYFCCEAHEQQEWLINHFFECNLFRFLKRMKDVETSEITSKLI